MKIVAIVHEAKEGGYWAEIPALPGAVTEADTLEELEANLREVAELFLGDETRAESALCSTAGTAERAWLLQLTA